MFVINVVDIVVIVFIIATVSADTESEQSSLDVAEPKGVFNSSSKEKPKRIMYSNETITERLSPIKNTTQYGDQDIMNTEELSQNQSTSDTYPFSTSIQRKGAHYASAALLSKRWVLSSAEIFFNVRESIKLFKVRLGTINCKKGGILMPIKSIEIHSSYIFGKPDFDLSILKMAAPVRFSATIRPIKLSNVGAKVLDANFLTTYWPRIIVNGHAISQSASERTKPYNMRVSTQKVITWAECDKIMKERNETLNEESLCLKPIVIHHSVCSPDVGAPVFANDGLWGITSGWTSTDCDQHESPTIVTRTSSLDVRSWLDEQLMDS